MSTKEKESKLEKLKQFFRVSKGNTVNWKGKANFVITSEIEAEIGPAANINQRIKVLKDLGEIISCNRLEEYGVERLWILIQDLFNKEVDIEYRHTALLFLKCLIQSQYEKLGMMRCHIFQLIKTHDVAEDNALLFEILQQLTQNGRDIQQFEEQFGGFVSSWLPSVAGAGKVAEFLELVVDFIKCNAAYVDECDIMHIVEYASFLCCWSNNEQIVKNSLIVLDTIVCYSELPSEALKDFTAALCRKVNSEESTHTCWKIMRNILGTHLGHSTLFVICKYLEDPGVFNDYSLLRGAVFYLNMGLWSDKRVPTLRCTPMSVLPSLHKVLECKHSMVIYEVIYSIERLINKHGTDLYDPCWSLILDIICDITVFLEKHQQSEDYTRINDKFQDALNAIEKFIGLGQFNGSQNRVFEIIGMSANRRPESSVLQLISYQALSIQPTTYEWLVHLDLIVDKYFKQEIRHNIRIKVIDVLSGVVSKYRYIYEEELIEKIILTYLQHIETEPELSVRNAVAQLLLSVALECDSKKCIDVLSILKKILNRPFEQNPTDLLNESDVLDVKTVVSGLVRIFHVKLYQLPSSMAVKTFRILISFLESHYSHMNVMDFNHSVYLTVFELLMKLRANKLGHLGLIDGPGTKYSPYITLDPAISPTPSSGGQTPNISNNPAPTPISLTSTSKIIITALRTEKDWRIINLLLQELPKALQNKVLITKQYGNDIGTLADALCAMITDKSLNLPESFKYVGQKVTRTEFQSLVFPVIAAIASYRNYLDFNQQARFISCLEQGLPSRSAGQCILALTTCILEMRDAMYKMLPEVLLNLSKISATIVIAIPILEFLSTLTSLPKVFGSFVGDQYMSVFAIALPYTNPFKYNHYTVSLAHHVIAVWFLKCRLPFRRDIVKFVTTGLRSNAIVPFEEGQSHPGIKPDLTILNEDSTSRKRSSSLTEEGSRRRERSLQQQNAATRFGTDFKPLIDESLNNFHKELTETCIDLMARYTYSSCEPRPTRSMIAEFLLKGGQSMTWLVGHKIVRVTTSGCTQKPIKNNLCERCWSQCRLSTDYDEAKKDDISEELLSGDAINPLDIDLDKLFPNQATDDGKFKDQCVCWCQSWAEVHVRRPTGDMSWIVRLQNETSHNLPSDYLLCDVSTIFLPSSTLTQPPSKDPSISTGSSDDPVDDAPSSSHSGILTISTIGSPQPASHPVSIPGSPASRQSIENDELEPFNDKTRNPVRRSNSSPEMSASWKNQFFMSKEHQKEKSGEDSPKMMQRLSCEAIPEEMTPPETLLHPVSVSKPPPSGGGKKNLKLDVGLSVDVAAAQRVRGIRAPLSSGPGLETNIDEASQLQNAAFTRDRSRTISVMSPIRKSRYEAELSAKSKPHSPRQKDIQRSGVSPSFVFLQLYHSAHFGRPDEKPILISNDTVLQRGINALDFTPPFETHKVGVLYVGPGQANNETEILRNEFGSLRYALFLHNLGTLINLKDADPQATFLGGLDHKNGVDGKYAYIWQSDIIQVIFHVATLMPNKESDPLCNTKKLHIGNDFVTIVYNESGEEYNMQNHKGQFNYVNVIIQPLDLGSNRVTVKARDDLAELIGHSEQKIVSDENLPLLARQLALHANLASQVTNSLHAKSNDPYASNWLERLRKIKRMRSKVLQLAGTEQASSPNPQNVLQKRNDFMDDFTEYA